MADEEHPIEQEVRQRQESALDVLNTVNDTLGVISSELSKRPTDEQLEIRLNDSERSLDYNRKVGVIIIILLFLLVGVPLLINSFANRATANVIKECTTPGNKKTTVQFDTGHKCFDEGQRRTAGILSAAAANEVIILNCYRDDNGNLRPDLEFAACVKDRITSPQNRSAPP